MKKLFCAFCVFFCAIQTFGQVTLSECHRMARENYPEIRSYNLISATEKCNIDNASKNWLPMVQVGVMAGWTNSSSKLNDMFSGIEDPALRKYYTEELLDKQFHILDPTSLLYRAQVQVNQNIYDGGVTALQKKAARAEAEVERAKINVSLHAVEERVDEVFFAILLLQERKAQMDTRMSVLESNLNKFRQFLKEGTARRMDVNMLEAEMISLRQQSEILQSNMEAYRHSLSLLTGKDMSKEKLMCPEEPATEPQSIEFLPEMQLLNQQQTALLLQEESLKSSLLPKVSFFGTAYFGYPNENVFKNLVSHSPRLNMQLGVQVVWNISPFYTRGDTRKIIRNKLALIDVQRNMAAYRTKLNNTSVNSQIKRLRQTQEEDDRIVKLRHEVRLSQEAMIDNGVADATELLKKISDEADAQLSQSIHRMELLRYMYQAVHNGRTEE